MVFSIREILHGKETDNDAAPLENVLRNSSWLYATQLISGLLTFVQAVIIARTLGVQAFGVLALVTTYVLLVIQLIDSRIWEAITTFVQRFRSSGANEKAAGVIQVCFLMEVLTGMVALGVLLVTADWASRVFIHDGSTAPLIRLFALLALVNIPQEASTAILRVSGHFNWIAYQSAGASALKTICVAVLCWAAPSVGGLLLVQLAVAAIAVVVLIVMAHAATRGMGLQVLGFNQTRHLKGHLGELFQFIFLSNVIATSRIFTSKVDTLILGFYTTPAGAGIYELAKRLVSQTAVLRTPLNQSVFPTISALVARKDFGRLRQLQTRISKLAAVVAVFVSTLGCLAAPTLIRIVFGAKFADSALVFQILIWQLISVPLIWLPGYLLALGYVWRQTAICVFDALIYLVLLVVMAPTLGIWGVAIASVLRVAIWIVMALGVLVYTNKNLVVCNGAGDNATGRDDLPPAHRGNVDGSDLQLSRIPTPQRGVC